MMKKKIITHDGSFHGDDLFACATMALYLEKKGYDYEIIRTRESDIIKKGDFVFDVGGVYSPSKNLFDHHQSKGAGKHKNGIAYASFGLAWKHFGLELCGGNKEAWRLLEMKLVIPIDAVDNGTDIAVPKYDGMQINLDLEYRLYSPTWKEPKADINKIFLKQVTRVKERITREIKVAVDEMEGRRIIHHSYKKSKDKRVVVLEVPFPRYMYQQYLSIYPEPVFVVVPEVYGKNWKAEAISKNPNTMENRKMFPKKWRGLLDNDPKLRKMTGVEDIIFCHRGGFLVHAKSKEGALSLARKALEF